MQAGVQHGTSGEWLDEDDPINLKEKPVDLPIRFLDTTTLAAETFLIRQLGGEGLLPDLVMLNSLVIRGDEPVIVDTGSSVTSGEWLERTFELVDPADVRWIYLSHDDIDHTGSLNEVLDRAPNATLVTNWFSVERMSSDGMLPLHRLRILNPGESFQAGDRTLTAVVPPAFDSPTTRGLFDSSTGVYWAADAFAATVSHEVDEAADLDPGYLRNTFLHLHRLLSPWHQWLDPVRYAGLVGSVRSLGARVAVGAHGPVFSGQQLDEALRMFEELPHLEPATLTSQADLDMLLQLLGIVPAVAEPALAGS